MTDDSLIERARQVFQYVAGGRSHATADDLTRVLEGSRPTHTPGHEPTAAHAKAMHLGDDKQSRAELVLSAFAREPTLGLTLNEWTALTCAYNSRGHDPSALQAVLALQTRTDAGESEARVSEFLLHTLGLLFGGLYTFGMVNGQSEERVYRLKLDLSLRCPPFCSRTKRRKAVVSSVEATSVGSNVNETPSTSYSSILPTAIALVVAVVVTFIIAGGGSSSTGTANPAERLPVDIAKVNRTAVDVSGTPPAGIATGVTTTNPVAPAIPIVSKETAPLMRWTSADVAIARRAAQFVATLSALPNPQVIRLARDGMPQFLANTPASHTTLLPDIPLEPQPTDLRALFLELAMYEALWKRVVTKLQFSPEPRKWADAVESRAHDAASDSPSAVSEILSELHATIKAIRSFDANTRVVIVSGLPGTGKSQLIASLGLPAIPDPMQRGVTSIAYRYRDVPRDEGRAPAQLILIDFVSHNKDLPFHGADAWPRLLPEANTLWIVTSDSRRAFPQTTQMLTSLHRHVSDPSRVLLVLTKAYQMLEGKPMTPKLLLDRCDRVSPSNTRADTAGSAEPDDRESERERERDHQRECWLVELKSHTQESAVKPVDVDGLIRSPIHIARWLTTH